MEDLASMCERQCRKACNLRSAGEELEETGSNGRARRYRKRGSPKPAAEARAMETDPSLVRLWSVKPVRTPVAILGSLGVCIYVPASRHWLISYSLIHLT